MNTFEKGVGAQESQKTPEELKARLSELTTERDSLRESMRVSGENVSVELGSEAYKDYGYTEKLEGVVAEIEMIEAQLKDIDDQAAAQRNLAL